MWRSTKVKAELHLTEDPATDKIVVPAGVTFADLTAAWRDQWGRVDRLYDEADKKGENACRSDQFCQERDYCQMIEQAIWERPVECLDDVRMLAELAATYDDDGEAATLAGAVLKILGPVETDTLPAALFAPPSTPRVGLSV